MAQTYPGQSASSQARDTIERAGETAASTAKTVGRDVSSAVGQAADMARLKKEHGSHVYVYYNNTYV